mmetsp:Transcript_129/g.417  ORF Transcript_129/g.417 Transcript_129/m.417 type:complete len:277 (+) Transcript_129:1117-1947(+)
MPLCICGGDAFHKSVPRHFEFFLRSQLHQVLEHFHFFGDFPRSHCIDGFLHVVPFLAALSAVSGAVLFGNQVPVDVVQQVSHGVPLVALCCFLDCLFFLDCLEDDVFQSLDFFFCPFTRLLRSSELDFSPSISARFGEPFERIAHHFPLFSVPFDEKHEFLIFFRRPLDPFPHLFVHAYATRPHGLGGPIWKLLGHFFPHASAFLVEQPFATFVHHQSVRVSVFLHGVSYGLLLLFGKGAVHLVCGGAVVSPRPTFRHLALDARVCACRTQCEREQ